MCGAELKVCRNCQSYDPRVAEQCRDRRADLVHEKDMANYCEYYEMAKREFQPPHVETARVDKARNALRKLLGDSP